MQSRYMDETDKIIYVLGLILVGGFSLIFILYQIGLFNPVTALPGCSFYLITRHYCPGCGGTRAVMALVAGHPLASFSYHPIVLYSAIWYGIYLSINTLNIIKNKKPSCKRGLLAHIHPMKFRVSYVYIGLAILLIQWFVKNLLGRPYLFS